MNVFKQMTGKQADGKGMSSGLAFLLSGVAGGLCTYLFLTEKGALSRKRMMEKATLLSDGRSNDEGMSPAKISVTQAETTEGQAGSDNTGQEETTPVSKAQNMISHLKHNKNSNASDQS